MPKKIYVVTLTVAERSSLQALTAKGKAAAQKRLHAQILRKADAGWEGEGWKDCRIVEAFDVARCSVERVRQRFVEEGLEAALNRKPQPNRIPRKINGQAEAHLIDAACGKPPEGRKSWDAQTAGRPAGGVGIGGQRLGRNRAADTKKNEIKPWLKKMWCLPGEPRAEFLCAMQDVLDVLSAPLRSAPPAGLRRGDQQATGRRSPRAAADPPRPAAAFRPRIPA